MNMLNNIHGMIDIDPAKAQAMVIDMSKLMRYMLYDSSRTRIPLSNEISFLHNASSGLTTSVVHELILTYLRKLKSHLNV